MKKTLGYFFNYFSGVACLVICILFGMEMVFQLSVENNVVVSTVHSGLFFYFLLDLFIFRVIFLSLRADQCFLSSGCKGKTLPLNL